MHGHCWHGATLKRPAVRSRADVRRCTGGGCRRGDAPVGQSSAPGAASWGGAAEARMRPCAVMAAWVRPQPAPLPPGRRRRIEPAAPGSAGGCRPAAPRPQCARSRAGRYSSAPLSCPTLPVGWRSWVQGGSHASPVLLSTTQQGGSAVCGRLCPHQGCRRRCRPPAGPPSRRPDQTRAPARSNLPTTAASRGRAAPPPPPAAAACEGLEAALSAVGLASVSLAMRA